MNKIVILLVVAIAAAMSVFASVTITPSSRTFAKEGGGNSILTSGSGTWTATTDVSWITLYKTSDSAGVSCVYIVNANFSADTHTGHITIDGNVHTVTQTGYTSSISPQSTTVTLDGGSGTVAVTVEAGISWSAASNEDWISIDTTSGKGPGTVTYTVAPYAGVVSRSGSITVAAKTFMITQTGTDVILSPTKCEKESGANIVQFSVTALATTKWAVSTTASWVSILDAGNGFGDSTIMLALAANPSSVSRTATVVVGTKTFEVFQQGTGAYALDILPRTATAASTGAFGNIAVLATPDMPWTAKSLTSWLTLSDVIEGEGNGNVGYVVSANPTLESRSAQVKITAKTPYPDVDILRGLMVFKGWSYGTARDDEVAGWTRGMTFKITQAGTLHRLFGLRSGYAALYVNIDNKLVFQSGNDVSVSDFEVGTNIDYGAFIIYDGTESRVYVGLKDSNSYRKLFTHQSQLSVSSTGSSTLPSSGRLVYGSANSSYYYWNRPLSERELAAHTTVLPKVAPEQTQDSIYANLSYYSNFKMGRSNHGAFGASSKQGKDRHNLNQNAMTGCVYPYGFDAYKLSSYSSAYYVSSFVTIDSISSEQYRHGAPLKNYSLNVWMKYSKDARLHLRLLQAASGTSSLCCPIATSSYSYIDGYALSPSKYYGFDCSDSGVRIFQGSESPVGRYGVGAVTADTWHMITLTYTYDHSRHLTLYIDGMEYGNTTASANYPCFYADQWEFYSVKGNTWNADGGAWIDEIETYTECLTSAKVRELYDLEKPLEVIHTVTQGAIDPMISTNEFVFPAIGGSGKVTATVAQNVAWSASKDSSDWVSFTSETEKSSSGFVTFDVGQNLSVNSRVATLTVAGLPVTIRQEGLNSSVSYDSDALGVDGGMGMITVTTEGNAYWTATSDVSWITVFSGAEGLGDGSVMFIADPYTLTSQSRTGSITVAGKKVYITQRGYELSVNPQIAKIGSNSGAGTIGVQAPIDAVWEALIDCDWITVIGSRNGVGNGVLNYTVAANTSGNTRTGHIMISGVEYTITQTTKLPLQIATVGNGSVVGEGDYEQGANAVLRATADDGYVFSHWSGDAVGVTNEINVVMDMAKNVTANFIPKTAADQLASQASTHEGFYTRDQIRNLEVGNLVLDVDSTTGKARIGVQLQETSDLSNPNWKAVNVTTGDLDIGADGTVGIKASATGNAKFFRVVTPKK